jgi:hypothetical protein
MVYRSKGKKDSANTRIKSKGHHQIVQKSTEKSKKSTISLASVAWARITKPMSQLKPAKGGIPWIPTTDPPWPTDQTSFTPKPDPSGSTGRKTARKH